MPKKRKKKNTIRIDFSGVKTLTLMEEKDYKIKVVEIEQEVGSDSGIGYLAWKFEVVGGKHDGRILYHNTSLGVDSLWNLKGVLMAQGIKVPNSVMDLDLNEIIQDAEECVASVFTDEYDGKKRSKISDIHSSSDVSVEDDYDEAETTEKPDADEVKEMSADELEDAVGEFDLDVDLDEIKSLKKKRAAVIKALEELEDDEEDDDEDEDEDDEDEEEENEEETPSEDEIKKMKRKELDKVVEDHDLDIDLDDIKGVKKQRVAVIEALSDDDDDDEDDDDDDDDEEEEKETKKKKKDKKEKPTKSEVKEMDDDDLEDLVFEQSLDVDLDDFKTTKAKIKAVIKALKL